jgi:hypothetical protein
LDQLATDISTKEVASLAATPDVMFTDSQEKIYSNDAQKLNTAAASGNAAKVSFVLSLNKLMHISFQLSCLPGCEESVQTL